VGGGGDARDCAVGVRGGGGGCPGWCAMTSLPASVYTNDWMYGRRCRAGGPRNGSAISLRDAGDNGPGVARAPWGADATHGHPDHTGDPVDDTPPPTRVPEAAVADVATVAAFRDDRSRWHGGAPGAARRA